MRIGIDVKHLRKNSAGIKVYLENLLDALQKLDSENTYFLFSPSPISYKLKNENFNLVITPSKLPGILWQQYELPHYVKDYKIDVFWGPEQTIFLKKLSGVKKVLTVHDFAYRRYPKTMKRSVRTITEHYGSRSILRSDALVCVSDFTAKELSHFFSGIAKDKIHVIDNGIISSIEKETESKEDFLLFTGSLEPRKNLKTLLRALEILKEKGYSPKLKIAGPAGWKNKSFRAALENSSIRDSVEILGFLSKEKLEHLYATAKAFVFPSLYEGFGLPVLEALNAKTRVFTSENSPMQEILGKLGIYFSPESEISLANSLEKLYLNSTLSFYTEKELEKRREILEKYSWENTAKKMLSVFESCVRPKS